MTYLQVLQKSSLPRLETEILTVFLLEKEREYLLTHPDSVISPEIFKRFKTLEKKRLADWSIAVLIGQKEFFGLNFIVDKNVLVPRPETELMIEEILEITKNDNNYSIVDLGTGSGAIIISLACELERTKLKTYKKSNFYAVDICDPALWVAKQNSIRNRQAKKISFFKGNLLEPLTGKKSKKILNTEIIIAANLPYLTPFQVNNSPSIKKEPRLALVAGRDGLKYYRELFAQLQATNKTFGALKTTILCEIDPSQAKTIEILAHEYFPDAKVEIKKDLAGKNRLAIIEI